MTARLLILFLVLIGIVVFSAANWSVMMAPTTLSLLVTTVEGPLGLIMLALMALLTVLFLVYVVFLQTSVLLEARRHARELQAGRELAERAEASRFTELQTLLETRLQELERQVQQDQAGTMTRLDLLDRDLRAAVEQAGNSLAAYIGELDERLAGIAPQRRPGPQEEGGIAKRN